MEPVILTAAIDDRAGVGKVSSRIGLQADAHIYDADKDVYELIKSLNSDKKRHCVLVDECQFLSSLVLIEVYIRARYTTRPRHT